MTNKQRARKIDAMARAICQERCDFRGEPPCWDMDGEPWPNPNCDEPGCQIEAEVAFDAMLQAGASNDA